MDFTPDAGAAVGQTTSWTCALAPGQSPSVDPSPQARVISAGVQTQIVVRDKLTELPLTRTGVFSVALLGGFPTTADGSTYIVEATISLSDGRILKLSAVLPCSSSTPE